MALEEGKAQDIIRVHAREAGAEPAVGLDVFPNREIEDERLVRSAVGHVSGHMVPGEGMVSAVPRDGAFARGIESTQYAEQAGLPAAVGAEQNHRTSGRDVEVEVAKHPLPPVAFAHSMGLNGERAVRLHSEGAADDALVGSPDEVEDGFLGVADGKLHLGDLDGLRHVAAGDI